MLETLAPVLTAIKNAGPVIYTAALVSTALIRFLPPDYISQLGLATFKNEHLAELGATFIISASLVLAHIVFAIAPIVSARRKAWQRDRAVRNYMKTLTSDEKKFLRFYIVDGHNSQNASIYNGIANGLEHKGLIYKASNVTISRCARNACSFQYAPGRSRVAGREGA